MTFGGAYFFHEPGTHSEGIFRNSTPKEMKMSWICFIDFPSDSLRYTEKTVLSNQQYLYIFFSQCSSSTKIRPQAKIDNFAFKNSNIIIEGLI